MGDTAALMYAGGGDVRPIRCLEAALFGLQDARYSELTRPTEFVAHILRHDDRLKVYLGASDQMFPPRPFDGLNEVAVDVAAGWQYWVVLHNHTVRTLDGKPALGMPTPSTSDMQLFIRQLVGWTPNLRFRVGSQHETGSICRSNELGRVCWGTEARG